MNKDMILYLLHSIRASMYEQIDDEEKEDFHREEAIEYWYKFPKEEHEILENHPIFKSPQEIWEHDFKLLDKIIGDYYE